MPSLIKLNNVRDLADARFAAAIPAEWIGFGVGYPDSLSIQHIQEIIGWCAGPALILEIAASTPADTVVSYCRVLPVNGIECFVHDLPAYKDLPETQGLQFIVKDAKTADDNVLSHLDVNAQTADSNAIYRVSPTAENAEWVNQSAPYAISLDCFPSAGTGMKDFEQWNDFLENTGFFE